MKKNFTKGIRRFVRHLYERADEGNHPIEGLPISTALKTVTRQMEVSGMRPRTISDYNLHVNYFAKITYSCVEIHDSLSRPYQLGTRKYVAKDLDSGSTTWLLVFDGSWD